MILFAKQKCQWSLMLWFVELKNIEVNTSLCNKNKKYQHL
jgi:hypothetical protein